MKLTKKVLRETGLDDKVAAALVLRFWKKEMGKAGAMTIPAVSKLHTKLAKIIVEEAAKAVAEQSEEKDTEQVS